MAAKPALANDTKALELTRTFKAPLKRVWQAWSTAAELQKWWGPTGCTVHIANFEFHPGGFCHYEMKFADAPSMWGRFNYREIAEREHIIWLNSFATERGGIARAPFAPNFPMEVLNTAHFRSEGSKTVVTLRTSPFGAPDEDIEGFRSIYDGMVLGYGALLDQLAAHVDGAV